MGRIVKQMLSFMLNSLTIKLATVILFFFLIFPSLKAEMDDIVKIILLWGGIKIVYDLFTKRTFLKSRYVFWLILFLFMEAVTIVLNYRVGIKNNASLFCYTAVALFVLYPNDEDKDNQKLIREMRLIGMAYIALCAAASVISLFTFVFQYNGELVYADILYHTGVFEGRLWGIYSNPNFPAAMLAAALSLMLFPICKKATINKKSLPLQYSILAICLILNFWYMVMAQSRGSIIAFLIFLCIYTFFLFRKKVFFTLRSMAGSAVLSMLVSICITGIVFFGMSLILTASNVLPTAFSHSNSNENNTSDIEKIKADSAGSSDMEEEIGRDVQQEQTNMLTGRSVIWKQGWDKFLKKPLFGYGNVGSTDGITLHNNPEEEPVKHLHNVVMQSLVSNGLAGTIPLAVFAVLSLTAMVRYIYRHRKDNWESTGIFYSCFAWIALYIANNTIEVFVVYSVSIPNFLFWIFLGYIMTFISREQPASRQNQFSKRLNRSAAVTEDRTI